MSNVLGLSPKHERNLRRLATYLWHLPKSPLLKEHAFDMDDFCKLSMGIACHARTTCDSVGCAVGHTPFAGLPKTRSESWHAYSERVFGVSMFTFRDREWNYMFGVEWKNVDNTPRGAARRILLILNRGIPEDGKSQPVKYRPKPDDFVKLTKAVLRRLGLKEQPV